jgi:hypothetical protein
MALINHYAAENLLMGEQSCVREKLAISAAHLVGAHQ